MAGFRPRLRHLHLRRFNFHLSCTQTPFISLDFMYYAGLVPHLVWWPAQRSSPFHESLIRKQMSWAPGVAVSSLFFFYIVLLKKPTGSTRIPQDAAWDEHKIQTPHHSLNYVTQINDSFPPYPISYPIGLSFSPLFRSPNSLSWLLQIGGRRLPLWTCSNTSVSENLPWNLVSVFCCSICYWQQLLTAEQPLPHLWTIS